MTGEVYCKCHVRLMTTANYMYVTRFLVMLVIFINYMYTDCFIGHATVTGPFP